MVGRAGSASVGVTGSPARPVPSVPRSLPLSVTGSADHHGRRGRRERELRVLRLVDRDFDRFGEGTEVARVVREDRADRRGAGFGGPQEAMGDREGATGFDRPFRCRQPLPFCAVWRSRITRSPVWRGETVPPKSTVCPVSGSWCSPRAWHREYPLAHDRRARQEASAGAARHDVPLAVGHHHAFGAVDLEEAAGAAPRPLDRREEGSRVDPVVEHQVRALHRPTAAVGERPDYRQRVAADVRVRGRGEGHAIPMCSLRPRGQQAGDATNGHRHGGAQEWQHGAAPPRARP